MTTAQKMFTRRSLLRTGSAGALALIGAGAIGAATHPRSAAAQDDVIAAAVGPFRTTAALNLRTQPSTSSPVILVIPYQAEVQAVGPEQNGFVNVTYNGKTGWAHGDYLTVTSGGGSDTPAYLGMGKTTAYVNMRSGAGGSYSVKRVVPAGASIELYDGFRNNYRLIYYGGEFGWVYADYVTANSSSGTLKTTANLNLRSQPALSGTVLKVIPAGASVSATNEIQNGFRKVTYGGTTGWASVAFLK